MAFLGPLLGSVLGMVGQNIQNKQAQHNQDQAYSRADQGIWNSGMQTEQLLQNLFGGGHINQPQFGGQQSFGGGVMGTGGQFMQPQGGQQQMQLPPQLMAFLQQMMQGGQNSGQRPPIVPGQGQPSLPGMMHPGAIPGPQVGQGGAQTGGGLPQGPITANQGWNQMRPM
jgi:hypothetical protein